jgi:RNA polymerase sigma-70 factor (ECF subfamily)
MLDSSTSDRSFPPTAWTVVVSARDPASGVAHQAREEVCRAYWPPVCAYLESLGLDHAQAQDVTQNVLASFCHDGWIERVDRAHGRLRHFFKAAARHAVANHFRDAKRLKRGNGAAPLSLDEMTDAELPQADAPGDSEFDRRWAWTIFERTMAALEGSYAQRGKAELFAALKPALISEDALQPYAAIGSRFDVGEQQIRIEVHRLRRRMAERLRAEVTVTLDSSASPAAVDSELRYLVEALAHERAH